MRTMAMLATLSLMLTATGTLSAADDTVPAALVGNWQGNARIIVDWCKQERLAVTLEIHSDGGVTGKIGDATLQNGRLSRNRGVIGRKLNLATDYIITGNLQGPIVAAEEITRATVSIPFNLANNALAGGVHTSGVKVGGKKNGILSAASLKLTRRE